MLELLRCCVTNAKPSASTLAEEEIQELIASTYFDRKEIVKWYKDFTKDCDTGMLNKEDFQTIYQQFFPNGDPSRFAEFVFNVFDANRDGFISFGEFIKALSITSRGTLDEKLDWAFSLYDMDNDGYITRAEMINVVESIYAMVGNVFQDSGGQDCETPAERVDKIFGNMDANNDGQISREEFKQGSRNDPWIVQALAMELQ